MAFGPSFRPPAIVSEAELALRESTQMKASDWYCVWECRRAAGVSSCKAFNSTT